MKTITIECRDKDNELEKLIRLIEQNGNGGHTFSVFVDPQSLGEKGRITWDGDGNDYIYNIEVKNKKD